MSDHTHTNLITLNRHILNDQQHHPKASGDLTLLLNSIQLGCKFVEASVRKASLVYLTGLAGNTNVQGEEVKKLDELANEIFTNSLINSQKTYVLVSEENEDIIKTPDGLKGNYCVCFDPLDGSSNIDAGVNVGTIFGIYKINSPNQDPLESVLRPGEEMVAAGYCMYGSSCNLVLTTGHGVNGFTLDPAIGEFVLTHPNIKIPTKGKIYSANEGNYRYWDEPCRMYVDKVKLENGYSLRYIGSMVADVHRTILYGGIFMYPKDSKSKTGKLRVLYECFPMAMLVEQAGGKATDGKNRILDLKPKDIHERNGIFLGSIQDVEELESFYSLQ